MSREHTHVHQGQKLVHDHEHGDREHDYFEHPEDGVDLTERPFRQNPFDVSAMNDDGEHVRVEVHRPDMEAGDDEDPWSGEITIHESRVNKDTLNIEIDGDFSDGVSERLTIHLNDQRIFDSIVDGNEPANLVEHLDGYYGLLQMYQVLSDRGEFTSESLLRAMLAANPDHVNDILSKAVDDLGRWLHEHAGAEYVED